MPFSAESFYTPDNYQNFLVDGRSGKNTVANLDFMKGVNVGDQSGTSMFAEGRAGAGWGVGNVATPYNPYAGTNIISMSSDGVTIPRDQMKFNQVHYLNPYLSGKAGVNIGLGNNQRAGVFATGNTKGSPYGQGIGLGLSYDVGDKLNFNVRRDNVINDPFAPTTFGASYTFGKGGQPLPKAQGGMDIKYDIYNRNVLNNIIPADNTRVAMDHLKWQDIFFDDIEEVETDIPGTSDSPILQNTQQILDQMESAHNTALENYKNQYEKLLANMMDDIEIPNTQNQYAMLGATNFVDPNKVSTWETHIENGGAPPENPDINYTTAYKNIYNKDFEPENDGKDPNDMQQNITNVYNVENTPNENNDKDNNQNNNLGYPQIMDKDDQGNLSNLDRAKGLPLDFSNTDNPYYVGSKWMYNRGGNLPKAQYNFNMDTVAPSDTTYVDTPNVGAYNIQTKPTYEIGQTYPDLVNEYNPTGLYMGDMSGYDSGTIDLTPQDKQMKAMAMRNPVSSIGIGLNAIYDGLFGSKYGSELPKAQKNINMDSSTSMFIPQAVLNSRFGNTTNDQTEQTSIVDQDGRPITDDMSIDQIQQFNMIANTGDAMTRNNPEDYVTGLTSNIAGNYMFEGNPLSYNLSGEQIVNQPAQNLLYGNTYNPNLRQGTMFEGNPMYGTDVGFDNSLFDFAKGVRSEFRNVPVRHIDDNSPFAPTEFWNNPLGGLENYLTPDLKQVAEDKSGYMNLAGGGELPIAKKGIEYQGKTYSKKDIKKLYASGDPVKIELANAITGKDTRTEQEKINEQMNTINQRRIDTEASVTETDLIGGAKDWSTWYLDPAQEEYRQQRYEAYKARREDQNMDVLGPEEYHNAYARFQEQNFWFEQNLTQEERNEANWDQTKSYGKNRRYKEALEGSGFSPMEEDMISHVQSGYIGGVALNMMNQNDPGGNITNYIQSGLDDQTVFGMSISPEDGVWGNTTNDQREGIYEKTEIEAQACTNAEELEALCAEAGGVWTPYNPEDKSGCKCSKEIKPPTGGGGTPSKKQTPFWLQDELGLANALDAKMSLTKRYPWAPTYNMPQIDGVFQDPTREIAAIGEQAAIASQAASAFGGPRRAMTAALAAQGKANTAIADTMNKVQSANVTIANDINTKNAEFEYKTQMLNNNELKQLYDNTVLTEENYDNALRKANAAVTAQLQNAYTNRANTANLNTIYPQFDVTPETGGIVQVTDPKTFYADPSAANAQDAANYDQRYAETIEMLRKNEVPESQWPKYNNPALNPPKGNTTWAQNNANAIITGGYPGGRQAKVGREVRRKNRILKKGGQLRNWFSPLRGN